MGVDVAAAILFRDEKVLIAQRANHDPLAGLWEFPGGKHPAVIYVLTIFRPTDSLPYVDGELFPWLAGIKGNETEINQKM